MGIFDYTLSSRSKWGLTKTDHMKGQLVLIKDDSLLPNCWSRWIIIAVHPEEDGRVRVVTLKTASGQLTMPITKICALPISDDNDQNFTTDDSKIVESSAKIATCAKKDNKASSHKWWYTLFSVMLIMSHVKIVSSYQPFNVKKIRKEYGHILRTSIYSHITSQTALQTVSGLGLQ